MAQLTGQPDKRNSFLLEGLLPSSRHTLRSAIPYEILRNKEYSSIEPSYIFGGVVGRRKSSNTRIALTRLQIQFFLSLFRAWEKAKAFPVTHWAFFLFSSFFLSCSDGGTAISPDGPAHCRQDGDKTTTTQTSRPPFSKIHTYIRHTYIHSYIYTNIHIPRNTKNVPIRTLALLGVLLHPPIPHSLPFLPYFSTTPPQNLLPRG